MINNKASYGNEFTGKLYHRIKKVWCFIIAGIG